MAAASPARGTARQCSSPARLPGERVMAKQTARSRISTRPRRSKCCTPRPTASGRAARISAPAAAARCSICAEDKQILAKQRVLLENLERIGHVTPERVLRAADRRRLGLSPQGPVLGAARGEEGQDPGRLPRDRSALRRRPARLPHGDPADRREDRRAGAAGRRHCRRAATSRRSSSSPAIRCPIRQARAG